MVLFVAMVTSSSVWAVCGLAFFKAFGYEFFASWFPAYLEKGRGVHVVQSGLLTTIPLIGSGLGNLLGGWLVDVLLHRTGSKWISRSGTAMMALTLCALCTLAAAWAADPTLAVAIISCGSFFSGFASPAAWAITLDISGKHTAIVFGVMNMVGNLGAFCCPIVLGRLFDYIPRHHADWNLVLYLFVAINLAGAIAAALLNPNRSAVERASISGPSH
jgi:MFS family permease